MSTGWQQRFAAPRGLRFALLLVVAAWQLPAAAHQFAHEAGVAENCTMCVQLEENESSTLGAGQSSAGATLLATAAPLSEANGATAFTAGYASRAPPLSDD